MPCKNLWCLYFTSVKPCVISCPLASSPVTLFPVMLLCQAYTLLVVTTRMSVLQFWTVFGRSMYQKSNPFPYTPTYQPSPRRLWGFFNINVFTRWVQPQAQHPTWRIRAFLIVLVITFGLPGMRVATIRYATAGIALRILWLRKPHHYDKVRYQGVERVSFCVLDEER